MKNFLYYAKHFTKTFAESPFNDVDALVLSWVSYFSFPETLNEGERIPLKDLPERGMLPFEEMYAQAFLPKKSQKLFRYMAQNPRFRDIRLFNKIDVYREKEEESFAAVCIETAPQEIFVSFRGSDTTFLCWKENFKLAYLEELPSQRDSAEYFQKVLSENESARFRLGGHSRGGTLAVYAAVQARNDPAQSDRIEQIFCFDGPGIYYKLYEEDNYFAVRDKIRKFTPQSSFVGKLLDRERDIHILIRSAYFSVLQHDPFSWKIRETAFQAAKRYTRTSQKLDAAVHAWLEELSKEEKERFIDIIFDALNTLDTHSFTVFFQTILSQIPPLYRQYKALGKQDKELFDAVMKKFFTSFKRKTEQKEKI